MELRSRGEDVQFRVTKGGILLRTFTAFRSLTFTSMNAILSRGYLGESTNRRDDIFQGVGLAFEMDVESVEPLELMVAVRDRATRRSNPNSLIINATFIITYPSGERPRITTPDLKFGPMALAVAGREEYVGQSIQAECEDFKYSPR